MILQTRTLLEHVSNGIVNNVKKHLFSSRSFQFPQTDSGKVNNTTTSVPDDPLITERQLGDSIYCSKQLDSRLAWVETLKPLKNLDVSSLNCLLGMVDLHPEIFATFPRIDLIHKNLYWQAHYKVVDWRCITTRADLPYRSRKKPWPQKGFGKARHGNRRTHIWMGGGQCKGPRGPESFYYMLPYAERLQGLTSMLSIKHAQDDLHIVDNLQLSDLLETKAKEIFQEAKLLAITNNRDNDEDCDNLNDDPLDASNQSRNYRFTKAMNEAAVYLRELVDNRGWGPSVLFVDDYSPADNLNCPSPDEHNLIAASDGDSGEERNLAISMACASYANHVDAELAPEASSFTFQTASPRATHPGRGLTLMPLHGLNLWSMLHHDTLVLSLNCLEQLEKRLIWAHKSAAQQDTRLVTPYLTPDPPDWYSGLDVSGEMEDDESAELASIQNRHFTGPIESVHWKKLKLQN